LRKSASATARFLVTEQAVALDLHGIELDLDLDVARDRLESAGEVVDQRAAHFLGVVDVVAHAVALVGELLEQVVVVVCSCPRRRC